jgi:two-component system, sensor histidine kinase and response regulator
MSTTPNPSNQAANLKTILIVDDDVQLSTTMALGLETYGYRTLCAANAAEGWKLARAHLPDLIISDIDMPGKDGRSLLSEMRADPELANRQFVLMTGKRDVGNTRAFMNIGVDDFLRKPFAWAALLACVNARLRRAEISDRVDDRVIERLRENLHSTLPHEFFAPLASILGLTELLDEELEIRSKDEIRKDLHDIRRAGQRLHRTVRNYLLILELESPATAHTVTSLAPAAVGEALTAGINAAAERHKRGADLTINLTPAGLRADPTDLSTLAEELADNAFNFSCRETPVEARAWLDGAWLRFSVTDAGRGMTPQQIEQLCAFQQPDHKISEQQGLGLGLALVRKLARHLGGELHLKSKAGEGTTSCVSLPIEST